MRETSSWHPILEGTLRDRALQAVEEIAADLPFPPAFSLARGSAGQSLFFLYLDQAFPGRGHGDTAVDLLERAIDAIRDPTVPAGLYSGFAGVAWAVEHVLPRLGEEEDLGEEIAFILQEHLSQSPWQRHYDLIGGLVGYGVYAIERLPRPGARECLDLVVVRLAELAERQGPGLTWFTPPELLPPRALEMCPAGYYNLGVSHGVPGVIALLREIEAAGLSTTRTRELLEGAMAWLRAQKLPPDSGSVFPYHVAPGIEPRPSRLAWCYGDLGIAAALRDVDETLALDLGRKAAAWPIDEARIKDAGLCHGAAGIAHLFNRLHQVSGDRLFAEAARVWFEKVLDLRRPGEGVAGFLSWDADERDELGWRSDPGFLMGAAGIGLALLSAATARVPDWDRVLLVS
jgi:class I lanthipeptide synthase